MYQLKIGKFMKVRFLDRSGKKIEISGEIDKNFTIAQGQRITFAEGTKFQSKTIKPDQVLYNQDPMSMTIGLSIKQNLVLMPVRFFVSTIEIDEELTVVEPVTNRVFDRSGLSTLIIPHFGEYEIVSEVELSNRNGSIKQRPSLGVTKFSFFDIDELLSGDENEMQIIGDSTE